MPTLINATPASCHVLVKSSSFFWWADLMNASVFNFNPQKPQNFG